MKVSFVLLELVLELGTQRGDSGNVDFID